MILIICENQLYNIIIKPNNNYRVKAGDTYEGGIPPYWKLGGVVSAHMHPKVLQYITDVQNMSCINFNY